MDTLFIMYSLHPRKAIECDSFSGVAHAKVFVVSFILEEESCRRSKASFSVVLQPERT